MTTTLKIIEEMDVPLIEGNCPRCGKGERSLIMMSYKPNKLRPEMSVAKLKCMCCSGTFNTYLKNLKDGTKML